MRTAANKLAKENHHRPFIAQTAATSKRQHNRNNQSSSSMCSSTGTAMNSVSSATPGSSSQSSRPCSCVAGMCGHNTPTTITNTSSSSVAADCPTPQTQSRNSTVSLANNQIDNKSAQNDQSCSSTSATTVGQCRICRKTIEPSEPCHLCSNCNQFICDDCASYSASDQFWMCSSCRRRAMNPAIPAEALKELGLNQNSSAVRRMTLRLNQNELKMAANKCSIESTTSSQAPASAQQPANRLASPQQRGQSQQLPRLRRDSTARRTTSDGDSAELGPAAPESRRMPPPLNRQNSFSPQQKIQQTGRRSLAQSSSQAQLLNQAAAKQQKPFNPYQPTAYACGAATSTRHGHQQQKQAQTVDSSQARAESSSAGTSPLTRPSDRQRCKSGGEPLKRVNSIQQQRSSAQKTLSQPMAATSALNQQHHQRANGGVQTKWQEPDAKRAPSLSQSQRMDSLGMQLDQRIEQSLSSMVAPSNPEIGPQHQWQPSQRTAANTTGGANAYMTGGAYASHESQFEQVAAGPDDQQQIIRAMMQNHRNSLAFAGTSSQQQQMFAPAASAMQLPASINSSRRGSQSQQPGPYMSQLIPVPPEQMHLRRLSDQSNLVRRSSIIASNLFDGTTIARNRSHSNIDSVHYMHQQSATGSRQHLNDSTGSFMNARWHTERVNHPNQAKKQLEISPYELSSSSANNLNYLQPNQQQQEHQQQRRLSDGGQYYAATDQQQISSIVTSYAHKQQNRPHHRQSSEEVHSDSSSDLDQDPVMRVAGGAYVPTKADYTDDVYAQQQTMTIPSVSVSEFAAAAARRRSSIHLQQQQQQQHDQMIVNYQQDNQITPMQINVAIEQVIQQQQQEQLAPGNHQDPQFFYMMRRGSSGRVLPSIPGGQSRSLLDLPLNGGSQSNGQRQLDSSADPNGANLSNGHTRNGSTAGLSQTTLGLPCLSPTIRRASAPEGQIIKIVVDDIDSSLPFTGRHAQNGMKHHQFDQHLQAGNFYERHILYRDDSLDPNGNHVGRGFGLQVMGGKLDPDGKLQACVKWVLQGGPADKVGIRPGDKLIEWDGKCLVDMSYEQVAEVIESSANIAEVLVKPKPERLYDPNQPPANYIRSQRRLSQQTERDLRRHHQVPVANNQSKQQRRMSCAVQSTGKSNETNRLGTGRRLPQIPPTIQTGDSGHGQLGVAMPAPIRHASTGQIDQVITASSLSNLLSSQPGGVPFMGQSGHLLGTYHLGADPQQQSRSAGELNRGSATPSNYPQAEMNLNKSNDGNALTLSAGAWIQPQQYGGSQQIMSSNGLYTTNLNYNHPQNTGYDELSGLIGLQVNVDERLATLEISILSAHNIDRDPSYDYVVKVRILPESNRFKVCTTQPSSDMNWKETFLFQNFPVHQVQRMALEIGIWVYDESPRLSAQIAQPICEALIPIQSARERNIDFWPLRPPPTSPQTRRKSLNDLIGNQYGQAARLQASSKPVTFGRPGQENMVPSAQNLTGNNNTIGSFGNLVRVSSAGLNDSQKVIYQRERSSSIRNLPDKSQMQPRRASDEVATSSSHRLMARLSPTVSRRSISVMNVGDGYIGGRPSRSPVSRLGSQANILKAIQIRRDSGKIH